MQEDIVAVIRADLSQFQASMRQMVTEVQKASQQSQQHVSGLDRSIKTLTSTTSEFDKALKSVGITISVIGLARLGQEAIQASTQMTALDNAFKAITGSATAAKAELGFVRAESNRIGVSFTDAAKSFQGMSAAARGTVLEGEGVRELFLGLAESGRVAGRSQEEMARGFKALQDIMAKGRLSAEDVNQQLAEALPGALGTLSRALKLSTSDLQKFMEAGRLGLPDLIKFGRQLRLEAAGGIAAAGQTFEAASTRMGNAVTRMLAAMGDIVTKNPDVVRALNAMAAATEDAAKRTEESRPAWDKWLSTIIQGIETAVTGLRTFRGEMDTWQKSSNLAIDKFIKGGGNALIQWLKDYHILRQDVALPFAEGAPGIILPSQTVQGRRLMGGPTVEGPEAASVGLFDPTRSRETALLPVKKTLDEIKQIQADIQSRKDILNNKDLQLSALQIKAINEDLGALQKKYLQLQGTKPPTDVTIFRDLPGEIKQLERFIATNAAGSTAVLQAQEKLTGLNAELAKMAMQHLPASVQEYRQLSTALAQAEQRLAATSAALKPEELQLAQAEITRLKEEVLKLNEAWLPPEVQQYRELTRALEQLETQLSKTTDPTEVRILERSIATLEDTLGELSKTLQQEVIDKGLDAMGVAMGNLEDDINEGIKAAQKFIEQQYELAKVLAKTPEEAEAAYKKYIAALKTSGVAAEVVRDKEIERQQEQAKEQQKIQKDAEREFERFQEKVADDVSDVLFDFTKALTDGSIKMKDIWKETLETIKDTFLRTLTDMAAAALVKQILIPVGVTGTGSTATGGGLDLSGLFKLFGGTSTGTTSVPGAAVTGGQLQGPTPTGAPLSQAGTTAGLLGTGISGSQAAGGVGAGLSAGMFTNQLFQSAGWSGTGANVAAGAVGGAVAGTLILPGFGTVIGAAVGALIPALMDQHIRDAFTNLVPGFTQLRAFQDFRAGNIGSGLLQMLTLGHSGFLEGLFGDRPDVPRFATAFETAGTRGAGTFLPGGAQRGPFGFVGPSGTFPNALQVPAPDFAAAFLKIDQALASHLSARQIDLAGAALQTQGTGLDLVFKDFDNEIADLTKDRMQTILGALAKEAGIARPAGFEARVFAGIGTEEEDLEALEAAFSKAAGFLEVLSAITDRQKPLSQAEQALAALNAQFDDLARQAAEYGVQMRVIEEARKREITTFWKDIVANLKTQQENLLRSIGGTRQTLEEALMTPAVIFARRQEELEQLQGEFAGAGPGTQVAMAPELLRRIQELFQLGASADVLGQDREALLRLQHDLLSFVDEIEQVAGQDAFNQQIAKAQAQVDLLGEIKQLSDKHLTEMNSTLHNIEKFLVRGQTPFLGEFQTGGMIPHTGLALVHQGERVIPASQVRTLSSSSVSSGPMTMNMAITVNASGLDRRSLEQTGDTIGRQAWAWIENAAERRRIPLKLDK